MEFEFPPKYGNDAATVSAGVRKALEKDKIAVKADGDLFVLPLDNVRYVQVTPAPVELPSDAVIRHARLVT